MAARVGATTNLSVQAYPGDLAAPGTDQHRDAA
jgi:hypothetical protein